MAGRGWVNRGVQVGVETTSGTPVAATKRMSGLSFDLSPLTVPKRYRTHGSKFTTSSQIHRIRSEGALEGPLSFDEIIYPLATLFTPPTPTTPSGGTNAREWFFLPLAQGNETPKTLTVEIGDSNAARVAANVAATGLTFTFAKEDVTVGGNLIGYAPTTGTMTGSPTTLPQVIASANQIDVYIHSVLGTLGATLFGSGNKLTDAMFGDFSIGEKFSPKEVHNTTYPSFKELVEKPSELMMHYASEANAQARGLYDLIASNPIRYVGIRITGPIIEGAINYMFELVAACKITAVPEEDSDDVWAYNFEFSPQIDSTLASAFWIRVVNTRTAL